MLSQKLFKSLPDAKPSLEVVASRRDVVLCHGVFDLFHYGHLQYLQEAKNYGGFLMVSVTADSFVNKGPGRPVFSGDVRAAVIAALEIVDLVVISNETTAVKIIEATKPAVYFKGADYANPESDVTGNLDEEKAAVERVGGRLIIGTTELMSSSHLINQHLIDHPQNYRTWLSGFKERWSYDDLDTCLRRAAGQNVVVLGEAIFDRYTTVRGLGKSSKHPTLAFELISSERQLGGSIAVARHLKGLGQNVRLVTTMSRGDYAELAGSQIFSDLELSGVVSNENLTSIEKHRFVDSETSAHVFETYEYELRDGENFQEYVAQRLRVAMEQADLLVVVDYGHGLITPVVLEVIEKFEGFLAVNAQANAGNRGINSVGKFTKPSLVCMNGREVEAELRGRGRLFAQDLQKIKDRTGADWIVVTEGRNGLAMYTNQSEFIEVPAFAARVSDPVGAGDAVFAVASVLLSSSAPPDLVGLFGNLAGAELVGALGNAKALDRSTLLKHASVLLK